MPLSPLCASCNSEAPNAFNEWTVCNRCATILVRDGDAFRAPRLYEWGEVLANVELWRELKAIQHAIVIRNELFRLVKERTSQAL